MKRFFALAAAATVALALGVSANTAATAKAAETPTADWMPFNYVLSEGFGSAMTLTDIRTSISYEGGHLTATGRTTKGGMGVTYLPEVPLDGFEMNVSLNSWQDKSPDRWFGLTFTDVGVKTDDYNEVPFYSKHSESWSNDYGAGVLFAVRPIRGENDMPGLKIQFNFIGIQPSLDANDQLASNAGEYADNVLGWGGWLSDIRLCDTDWQPKTDYDNIHITLKKIDLGNGNSGYAFDINDGYWIRTDAIAWDELADDVLHDLGVSSSSELTDEIKKKFVYGPAYDESIVAYANWGEPMYALDRFESKLEAQGKRLYFSYMYKDAWDMSEGTDDASFTINSIMGQPIQEDASFSLAAPKTLSGDIAATLTETSLHAGVYPSAVQSIVMTSAPAKSYSDAALEAVSKLSSGKYSIVNFKGKTADGTEVSLVEPVQLTLNLKKYGNAKLYKIVGDDIDLVGEGESVTFKANSSNVVYAITATQGDLPPVLKEQAGGNDGGEKGGCSGGITACGGVAFMALAVFALGRKKR